MSAARALRAEPAELRAQPAERDRAAFIGNAGHALQRTELTTTQGDILRALAITPPAQFLQLITGA